jgi:hypothetical protein
MLNMDSLLGATGESRSGVARSNVSIRASDAGYNKDDQGRDPRTFGDSFSDDAAAAWSLRVSAGCGLPK